MKLLSADDATFWCKNRGILATKTGALVDLRYPSESEHSLRVGASVGPPQLLAMAHSILLQDLAQPAEDDFAGALVWLRDWNIWSETFEKAGLRLVELFRRSLLPSNVSSLSEVPACAFDPQELVDAQIAVTLPFLFQWDAYVIPSSGRCFALISHDGYLRVDAMNASILSRIYDRFEAVNWNPERC